MLEVKPADVTEFVAARQLGEETFGTGVIPRERFRAGKFVENLF